MRNRLHELLRTIEDALRVDGGYEDAADRNAEIGALRRCFMAEYADTGHEWDAVLGHLLPAVASASVVAVNSQSPASLDYDVRGESGLTVIAVGGFSLSRGLTLEGLTVSYFLRNSLMYDTLMQMGRWFGYRPNYEDLCRVWMLPDAASWYAHISDATEELQHELKRMEQANATPEQFGLAVRSHPSALMVTARNKMGSGEKHVLVGLSNNFIETTKLRASSNALATNRGARDRLLGALLDQQLGPSTATKVSGGLLVSDVPVDIIDNFLRDFENDRESVLTDTRPVRAYIESRKADELAKWDIIIASRNTALRDEHVRIAGWDIASITRSVGGEDLDRGVLAISGKRSRVASRGMEKAGVERDRADLAEQAYRLEKKIGDDQTINYPDRIYREVRSRPLLMLFNLMVKPDDLREDQQARLPKDPVVGWGISFPKSGRPDEKVEYILNTTKLKELFGDEDSDEGINDDPWRGLSAGSIDARRVSGEGRHDFFWIMSGLREPGLLLRLPAGVEEPKPLPKLRNLEIAIRDVEGSRALIILLKDQEQRELFAGLCNDVLRAAEAASAVEEALARAVRRLMRWHHLLRGGRGDQLSIEEQRGLLG
jgi:hypothetical protein